MAARGQRDVSWQVELIGGVPTRLVEQDDAMSPWRDLGGDLVEMPLHGSGVTARHDHRRSRAPSRENGAEDIGRLGTLILGRRWPGTPARPTPGYIDFLANPGFILPPDLYRRADRERGLDQRHACECTRHNL